jgi:hypothetical protein
MVSEVGGSWSSTLVSTWLQCEERKKMNPSKKNKKVKAQGKELGIIEI